MCFYPICSYIFLQSWKQPNNKDSLSRPLYSERSSQELVHFHTWASHGSRKDASHRWDNNGVLFTPSHFLRDKIPAFTLIGNWSFASGVLTPPSPRPCGLALFSTKEDTLNKLAIYPSPTSPNVYCEKVCLYWCLQINSVNSKGTLLHFLATSVAMSLSTSPFSRWQKG